MKKIVFLTCFAFLAAWQNQCCAQSASSTATMITLNGYSLDDANKMINAHLDEPGDYTKAARTNIWFSKAVIFSIDSLLNAEKDTALNHHEYEITDGLRIYFAREGNYHNIILVSTRSQGIPDDYSQSYSIHQDYFRHSAAFLKSAAVKGIVDHGQPGSTATSYSDLYNYACPVTDNCILTGDPNHYITCATAINWINNYNTGASDAITETGEWFDLDLLDNINNQLQTDQNNLDGVRIYFSKNTDDGSHCFIFVTTQKANDTSNDYYSCLPPPQTINFQQRLQSKLTLQLNSLTNFKKSVKLKQKTLSNRIKELKRSVSPNQGGNDNGEQCPNNCYGLTWP